MALKLENGDYVINEESGSPETVEYLGELLQRCVTVLNAKRGRFYPNKSFGSRIKEGLAAPESEYAFAFAAEALDGLDGVLVKAAAVKDGTATITLIINNSEEEVEIKLDDNI